METDSFAAEPLTRRRESDSRPTSAPPARSTNAPASEGNVACNGSVNGAIPRRIRPDSARLAYLRRYFMRLTLPTPEFLKRLIRAQRREDDARIKAQLNGKFRHVGGGKYVGQKPKRRHDG